MNTAALIAPSPSSRRDGERAIPALVVAFASDPIIRWLLPTSGAYLTGFTQVLHLVADVATTGGAIDSTGHDAAAAIWHGPGVEVDDEALGGVLAAAIDPARHEDAFTFLGRMEECHPTEPHWYLPFVGVDPHHQGRGHGSTLLEQGLARADADGLPAYLEASSPRNRRLYERHGFEAFAEVQVSDSPPMWPMLRPAA